MIPDKLYIIKTILLKGHIKLFAREVLRRFFSNDCFYCFSYDLTMSFNSHENEFSLRICPASTEQVEKIIGLNEVNLSSKDFKERMVRMSMYRAGLKTCYVAVDDNDEPCHLLWLVGHGENEKLQDFFKEGFLMLSEDEVLIEGVFTRKDFRRRGIMMNALSLILEHARNLGARNSIAYVRQSNIPSIKGFIRAGFFPFKIRKEYWRLFNRRLSFETINKNTQRDLMRIVE